MWECKLEHLYPIEFKKNWIRFDTLIVLPKMIILAPAERDFK